MFRYLALTLLMFLVTACGGTVIEQPVNLDVSVETKTDFVQWDVPHTNITMLLPDGWIYEYYQGTFTIAPDSKSLFYSPYEPFTGARIDMFLSDGPRAVGPSFDLMRIAKDFVADQTNVTQPPKLIEDGRRQIITTLYVNKDSKGKLIDYFVGFVMENQQLTVFIAATPLDTEVFYLPILQQMLTSIEIRSEL